VWDGQNVNKGDRQNCDAAVDTQLRVLSHKHERRVQMHMKNRLSRSRLYGDEKPKPPPGEKNQTLFPFTHLLWTYKFLFLMSIIRN
jgi:hypothetical protein